MDGQSLSDPLQLVSLGAPLDAVAGAVTHQLSTSGLGLTAAVLVGGESRDDLVSLLGRDRTDEPIDSEVRALAARAIADSELLVSPWDCDLGTARGLMAAAPIAGPSGWPYGAVIAVGDEVDFDQGTLSRLLSGARIMSLAIERDSGATFPGSESIVDAGRLGHILREIGESRVWGSRVAVMVLDIELDSSAEPDFDAASFSDIETNTRATLEMLASTVRPTDIVSRLPDGLFAIVCPHLASTADADPLAQRVKGRLTEAGAGILRFGMVAADCPARDRDLITEAHPSRAQTGQDTPLTAERIVAAIISGEMEAHFQPIATTRDRNIVAVEALARWSGAGVEEFVEILEQGGQIGHLTDWMVDTACAQLASWQRAGHVGRDFYVSVNVSAIELADSTLVDIVADCIRRHGLQPANLCVEITETAALAEEARTGDVLNGLAGLGVRVAIDDFGTGYASFGSLRRLSAHVLKIDRSLVNGLPDRESIALVQAAADLASTFGLATVAEGVETEDELSALVQMGVPLVQGYLISRPVPDVEIVDVFAAYGIGSVQY